jgi:hypothetical protein
MVDALGGSEVAEVSGEEEVVVGGVLGIGVKVNDLQRIAWGHRKMAEAEVGSVGGDGQTATASSGGAMLAVKLVGQSAGAGIPHPGGL